MPAIILVLAFLGLATIVAGVFALRATWTFAVRGPAPEKWGILRIAALIIGVACGIATAPLSYWMGYPIATPEGIGRIIGIPFFVAFFDSAGRDYVGPFTWPGFVANVVFWFLVPQVILLLYGLVWRKRRASD